MKKLGTIQDTETHQTNASNNDCKSEILATDATTNTLTQNNTTNTAAVVPTAPQNTDVSMDQFLATGINVSLSPPSYPIDDLEITCINPDLQEDFKHNIGNEANTQNGKTGAELSHTSHDCSAAHSDSHVSAVELPTGKYNDTAV